VARVASRARICSTLAVFLLAAVLAGADGALAQVPPAQGQAADGGATVEPQQAAPSGPPPQAGSTGPAQPSAAQPDISFTATIHMDNLRFQAVPQPTVQVFVQPSGQPVVDVQVENLPAVPQANVDYPNVTVRVTVSGTLADAASVPAQAPATPTPAVSP
jgi:hypothetical protein